MQEETSEYLMSHGRGDSRGSAAPANGMEDTGVLFDAALQTAVPGTVFSPQPVSQPVRPVQPAALESQFDQRFMKSPAPGVAVPHQTESPAQLSATIPETNTAYTALDSVMGDNLDSSPVGSRRQTKPQAGHDSRLMLNSLGGVDEHGDISVFAFGAPVMTPDGPAFTVGVGPGRSDAMQEDSDQYITVRAKLRRLSMRLRRYRWFAVLTCIWVALGLFALIAPLFDKMLVHYYAQCALCLFVSLALIVCIVDCVFDRLHGICGLWQEFLGIMSVMLMAICTCVAQDLINDIPQLSNPTTVTIVPSESVTYSHPLPYPDHRLIGTNTATGKTVVLKVTGKQLQECDTLLSAAHRGDGNRHATAHYLPSTGYAFDVVCTVDAKSSQQDSSASGTNDAGAWNDAIVVGQSEK
ncbi:hypothetical protein CQR48_1177 [Bifidobacterium thermophilum]|uniref:hypothetical protein n=1 Tax=Bifidobacterium thermophilum TaxID=33905 RepID=UPI000CCA6A3E|nr:hypothetical protein [Bifidobacterium thermophilum]PKU88715.1 hypothetical protein CQR48_1177 [Bifidobacterium thermophilum]